MIIYGHMSKYKTHDGPDFDLHITFLGTMQIVEARHIELFLSEGYQDGSWDYEQIGHHDIIKHAEGASGGIFDIKHLKDTTTSGNFLMHACLTYKSIQIDYLNFFNLDATL